MEKKIFIDPSEIQSIISPILPPNDAILINSIESTSKKVLEEGDEYINGLKILEGDNFYSTGSSYVEEGAYHQLTDFFLIDIIFVFRFFNWCKFSRTIGLSPLQRDQLASEYTNEVSKVPIGSLQLSMEDKEEMMEMWDGTYPKIENKKRQLREWISFRRDKISSILHHLHIPVFYPLDEEDDDEGKGSMLSDGMSLIYLVNDLLFHQHLFSTVFFLSNQLSQFHILNFIFSQKNGQ